MTGDQTRIDNCFETLRKEGRAGLITYIVSGDPDLETSQKILDGLPDAGADIIELGMAFTDPMADGPSIQAGGIRALANGITLKKTLEMARLFRAKNTKTPLILMGYFNPIHAFGVSHFIETAKNSGVDGIIVVDLPPEEDNELCVPAINAGLSFIRLATPTTDERRLTKVIKNTSGFIYYVSYTGITGSNIVNATKIEAHLDRISKHTDLPIAVGFGIRSPDQAAKVARLADAAVVGTAFVDELAKSLDEEGKATDITVSTVLDLAGLLSKSVRSARMAS